MLTAKQRRAIDALLTCRTQTEAAQKAGISRQTLRKYRKNPEFEAEYNKAARGVLEDAKTQAAAGLGPAVDALIKIVIDDEAQDTARVSAAKAVLEYSLRLCDYVDIARRLEKLEQYAQEGGSD